MCWKGKRKSYGAASLCSSYSLVPNERTGKNVPPSKVDMKEGRKVFTNEAVKMEPRTEKMEGMQRSLINLFKFLKTLINNAKILDAI